MLSLIRRFRSPRPSGSTNRRVAPAFTRQDKLSIATWRAMMERRGIYTEINCGHDFLTEALHVLPGSPDDAWWMVHMTPTGGCAVRQWPGIADIVPSVAEALDIIEYAIDTRLRESRGLLERQSAGTEDVPRSGRLQTGAGWF